MRQSFLLLPLGLLVTGLFAGEDRTARSRPDKARPADPARGAKAAPYFDAGEFIRQYDKNKDGYLSKAELPERFRHNFARLDANKDGKISRAELEKGAAYLLPRRRPLEVVYAMIEMSDCDECCAEELQMLYDLLRKLDTNKDGKLQASEMRTARTVIVKKCVDAIFKALDANKDGKISRAEAKGMVKRNFDELDTNKDGFIQRNELMRAASEKPAKPPRRKGDRTRSKAPDRPSGR